MKLKKKRKKERKKKKRRKNLNPRVRYSKIQLGSLGHNSLLLLLIEHNDIYLLNRVWPL